MNDFRWLVLENIIIVIASSVLAYLISPWCLFMLVGCNTFSLRNNADSPAK